MVRRMMVVAVAFVLFMAVGSAFAQNVGDKGKATWRGSEYPAQITKKSGDRCFIHWIGENGSWDEWQDCAAFRTTEAGAGKVAANPGTTFGVGDAVTVLWKGTWYNASVLAVNSKKGTYKIHYDGYSASWDEWVGSNRIRGR